MPHNSEGMTYKPNEISFCTAKLTEFEKDFHWFEDNESGHYDGVAPYATLQILTPIKYAERSVGILFKYGSEAELNKTIELMSNDIGGHYSFELPVDFFNSKYKTILRSYIWNLKKTESYIVSHPPTSGGADKKVSRKHDVVNIPPGMIPLENGDIFDWQNKGPVEFIECLKQKDNVPWHFIVKKDSPPCSEADEGQECSFAVWQYGIFGYHINWIREDDIPQLIELIDSRIPCASVASSYSSLLTSNESTVGNEASYLIKGFKQGKYPSGMNSVGNKEVDKDEIRKWWTQYKIEKGIK
jgi:hypothetical protein